MKSSLLVKTEAVPAAAVPEVLDDSEPTGIGALTPSEQVRLEALEREVENNMLGYVRAGTALWTIRRLRLHRGTHALFEDYLKERFELSRSRAYQLMDGAKVYQHLHNCGIPVLPCNEAQARPLVRVPEDAQPLVWHQVVEQAGDAKITAGNVSEAVREYLGKKTKKHAERQRDEVMSDKDLPDYLKDELATMVTRVQFAKDQPYKDALVKHLKEMLRLLSN